MPRFHSPTFNTASIDELVGIVAAYKRRGMRFVQLCATTREDSCELLYAFSDPQSELPGLVGITVDVPDGASVPSITEHYPAAFVFENETHDLFGIRIEGINIDFEGEFYTVSEKYPMNPRAAQLEQQRAQEAAETAEDAEPAEAQEPATGEEEADE